MVWTHCDQVVMVTWEFFLKDGPQQKPFIWSFSCLSKVNERFKRKKPECIVGSRDSTPT
jgi:hypothetical protein